MSAKPLLSAADQRLRTAKNCQQLDISAPLEARQPNDRDRPMSFH
jgi:hypothetical protein